jgi:hypothetical protein
MGDPSSLKTRLETCAHEFFIENCSKITEIAEILAIAKFDHKSKWGWGRPGTFVVGSRQSGEVQNFIPDFKFNFVAI